MERRATIREWLQSLARTTISDEADDRQMRNLLRNYLGFREAVVTAGIVYLEGKGSMEYPPTSIHTVASELLSIK